MNFSTPENFCENKIHKIDEEIKSLIYLSELCRNTDLVPQNKTYRDYFFENVKKLLNE